ncbi:hypothetical protein [Spirosoma agri]|nr:hypothetical protein [Spirosoma agri]
MTPGRRLDQIEPVLADVAQKTDRLIESNGQIFELATKNNTVIEITAKGLADLTVLVNGRFNAVDSRFEGVNGRFDMVDDRFEGVNSRFDMVDDRFEAVNGRFDTVDDRFEGVNGRFDTVYDRLDEQGTNIQELKVNVVDLQKGQSRIEENQQQILAILRERLG